MFFVFRVVFPKTILRRINKPSFSVCFDNYLLNHPSDNHPFDHPAGLCTFNQPANWNPFTRGIVDPTYKPTYKNFNKLLCNTRLKTRLSSHLQDFNPTYQTSNLNTRHKTLSRSKRTSNYIYVFLLYIYILHININIIYIYIVFLYGVAISIPSTVALPYTFDF